MQETFPQSGVLAPRLCRSRRRLEVDDGVRGRLDGRESWPTAGVRRDGGKIDLGIVDLDAVGDAAAVRGEVDVGGLRVTDTRRWQRRRRVVGVEIVEGEHAGRDRVGRRLRSG